MMKKKTITDDDDVRPDQSLSVAGRPLPPPPPSTTASAAGASTAGGGSIVLFYQYKEPMWDGSEFAKALKLFLSVCTRYDMKGRGRIAPEGVNCTFSNSCPQTLRSFCNALRDPTVWTIDADSTAATKTLFEDTDFKITDAVPSQQLFKSLNIRKVEELVAYGLEKEKAPSIAKFGGTHLTALDYHEALKDPNTVVIDVRNAYETAIGTIRPPPGGATLLDPKMRNSHEWPKWLASKETQQQLHGKKVLTFCTGGIRCERATALINQMAHVASASVSGRSGSATSTTRQSQATQEPDPQNYVTRNDNTDQMNGSSMSEIPNGTISHNSELAGTGQGSDSDSFSFKPEGVFHMRGGIERYLKTFPSGGFWRGKNYLFDKRIEQVPENKSVDQVEAEIVSGVGAAAASSNCPTADSNTALKHAKCCLCRCPWTTYRGKFKCQMPDCGVPVLVCDVCAITASQKQRRRSKSNDLILQCELCREGYRAPQNMPDLVAMRKQAEKLASENEEKGHQTKSKRHCTALDIGGGVDNVQLSKKVKIDDSNPVAGFNTTRQQIKSQDRLFLSKLPLAIRKSQIEEWLQTPVVNISWLVDQITGSFYGSCIVQVDENAPILKQIFKTDENSNSNGVSYHGLGTFPGTVRGNDNNRCNSNGKGKKRRKGRQPKISPVFLQDNGKAEWPPDKSVQTEFPPIGFISKVLPAS